MKAANNLTKRPHKATPTVPTPTARAAMLDRLADLELQHGHHSAAEHLARQAAAMRGAGQAAPSPPPAGRSPE